jgi:peptidyl-Lys metalloendopeptidase
VDSNREISCTVTARRAAGDIVVTLTLANRSQSPFGVLRWNLPRDGKLTAPLFVVARGGLEVPYKGPVVKRAIDAASYETLAPGASATVQIGLEQAYDVDSPGTYTIVYRAPNQRGATSDVEWLTSEPETFID